jgi:hypothetical protein
VPGKRMPGETHLARAVVHHRNQRDAHASRALPVTGGT